MESFEMDQLRLIVAILFGLISGAYAFSYKDINKWGDESSICDYGHYQSPITLYPNSQGEFPSYNKEGKIIEFNKVPDEIYMANNGYTVVLKPKYSGNPPRMEGGPLDGTYVFEKTTFHWSGKRGTGSEHNYYNNDKKKNFEYDMEMQMYFYKQDYKSFEKAQYEKGGLAVIVNWLKAGFEVHDKHFDNLEKELHQVQEIKSSATITQFALTRFVNKSFPVAYYQYYEGSLTYPSCAESVNWFIYLPVTAITDTLLKEFWKINLNMGYSSNIRPTQSLYNRQVKTVKFRTNKQSIIEY